MESQTTVAEGRSRARELIGELDKLFQRQIELMRSETFSGLTPAEHQEYERIVAKISGLFRELGRLK